MRRLLILSRSSCSPPADSSSAAPAPPAPPRHRRTGRAVDRTVTRDVDEVSGLRQAQVLACPANRSDPLPGAVRSPHHASNAPARRASLERNGLERRGRTPAPVSFAERNRGRSWWTGSLCETAIFMRRAVSQGSGPICAEHLPSRSAGRRSSRAHRLRADCRWCARAPGAESAERDAGVTSATGARQAWRWTRGPRHGVTLSLARQARGQLLSGVHETPDERLNP
jgi:hypothetical protein